MRTISTRNFGNSGRINYACVEFSKIWVYHVSLSGLFSIISENAVLFPAGKFQNFKPENLLNLSVLQPSEIHQFDDAQLEA